MTPKVRDVAGLNTVGCDTERSTAAVVAGRSTCDHSDRYWCGREQAREGSPQWLKCTTAVPQPTPFTQTFCMPWISGARSCVETNIGAVNDSMFPSPAR